MRSLFDLREAARHCASQPHAETMREAADHLAATIKALADEATRDNMVALTGAWMRARRAYDAAPPLGGDGTAGGVMPDPARVAA